MWCLNWIVWDRNCLYSLFHISQTHVWSSAEEVTSDSLAWIVLIWRIPVLLVMEGSALSGWCEAMVLWEASEIVLQVVSAGKVLTLLPWLPLELSCVWLVQKSSPKRNRLKLFSDCEGTWGGLARGCSWEAEEENQGGMGMVIWMPPLLHCVILIQKRSVIVSARGGTEIQIQKICPGA